MNVSSFPINSRSMKISDYYEMSGNASLKEADVICIAENPLDPCDHACRAEVIKLVGSQSLIIGENIPFGDERCLMGAKITAPEFKELTVRGWDLPIIEEHVGALEKERQTLIGLATRIQNKIDSQKWSSFFHFDSPFYQLLKLVSDQIEGDGKEILELLNRDLHTFVLRVNQFVKSAFFENRKKLERFYKATFQARLRSLHKAVVEGLTTKRQVIALVNGNFLIPNPRLIGPSYDIHPFSEFLNGKKFVILNPKSSPLRLPSHTINQQFSMEDIIPSALPPKNTREAMSTEGLTELLEIISQLESDDVGFLELGNELSRPSAPFLDMKEENEKTPSGTNIIPAVLVMQPRPQKPAIDMQNFLPSNNVDE